MEDIHVKFSYQLPECNPSGHVNIEFEIHRSFLKENNIIVHAKPSNIVVSSKTHTPTPVIDYSCMKRIALMDIAKQRKFKSFQQLNKEELIKLLSSK